MKKLLLASALAFSTLPVVAHAEPVDDWGVSYLDVPYGDLNLDRPEGAAIMLNRVKLAARRVCGNHTDLRELREHRMFKICVREAVEEALDEVDLPPVTSLYRHETGERLAYEDSRDR